MTLLAINGSSHAILAGADSHRGRTRWIMRSFIESTLYLLPPLATNVRASLAGRPEVLFRLPERLATLSQILERRKSRRQRARPPWIHACRDACLQLTGPTLGRHLT